MHITSTISLMHKARREREGQTHTHMVRGLLMKYLINQQKAVINFIVKLLLKYLITQLVYVGI